MTLRSTPTTLAPRKPRRRLGLGARLSTLRELMRHFAGTGRWWLVPMMTIFMLSAALLVIISIVEYAAPFVYTLF